MKRILIDRTPDCVRTAVTTDGKLTEIYIDPIGAASQVGHVYVGRVQNLLPGRFAFVDIGTGKNAFMNLPRAHGLKKGDAVLIQIYRDAHGTKGAYGGQELKLKGKNIILFASPRGEVGVSRKITDPQERERLRSVVHSALEKGFGAVVRTNAEGCDANQVVRDSYHLTRLFRELTERATHAKPPVRLHPPQGEAFPKDLLEDLFSQDIAEILVDGSDMADSLQLEITERVTLHTPAGTLFDAHNIPAQIRRALEKTLYLPCGGHITFEQTEACVVIDVNTGAYSGAMDYRAAVLRTNLEAAAAIAAQLQLRNYSGIIIIDFIDMRDRADKDTLLTALAAEIKKDRIKTEFVGMTELGLVQLTRRRTRPPLHFTAHTHTKSPV